MYALRAPGPQKPLAAATFAGSSLGMRPIASTRKLQFGRRGWNNETSRKVMCIYRSSAQLRLFWESTADELAVAAATSAELQGISCNSKQKAQKLGRKNGFGRCPPLIELCLDLSVLRVKQAHVVCPWPSQQHVVGSISAVITGETSLIFGEAALQGSRAKCRLLVASRRLVTL